MTQMLSFLILIFGTLLVSCVPTQQATTASCDRGSTYNPVTRSCDQSSISYSFSLDEGETKNFLIPSNDLLAAPPISCQILAINTGVAADCLCQNGTCYIRIQPDSSTDPARVSTPPFPDYYGETDLIFKLFDGTKYSTNAWLSINVNNIDDQPYVNDQTFTLASEGLKYQQALDVTEVDGQGLTYTITKRPSYGEASISPSGVLTIDYSFSNLLNDGEDINFAGTDTLTYRVEDGTSSPASGKVQFIVPDSEDPPEILDSDITTLQSELNANPLVIEEKTFTVKLPFHEYDPNQFGLLCNVPTDAPDAFGVSYVTGSNQKLTLASPCTCAKVPPLYLTSVCSATFTGSRNKYGETHFSYTVSTGAILPVTGTTAQRVVTFSLDDVNDPPVANMEVKTYPTTPTDVASSYKVYLTVPAADQSSDDEQATDLTYQVKTKPAHGSLYKCSDSTCTSSTILVANSFFDQAKPLYYIPDDTSALGNIWKASYIDEQGIKYQAKRKGTWGDGISINIVQSNSIPINTTSIAASVATKTITIYVNNSATPANQTTAQTVCDAIAINDQASSLVSATCTDGTVKQQNSSVNLASGQDGLDFFDYEVKDQNNVTSYLDGVIYFTGEGVVETLGRNDHFTGQESTSNLPIDYSIPALDPTYPLEYTQLGAIQVDVGANFTNDCMSSATPCIFTPSNGDISSTWVKATGSLATSSTAINIASRRYGIVGNTISITTSDNPAITAGSEKVNVAGTAISIEIDSGVTTANQLINAIQSNPHANALVEITQNGNGTVNIQSPTLAGGVDGVAYVHYWHSEPPNINALGVLYINLTDVVNSTTKQFDAPTLCHYGSAFEYPECGETGCIGSQDPRDKGISPSKAGIYYYQTDITDTDPSKPGAICYVSTGTTSSDWEPAPVKNLYLGVDYNILKDLTFFKKIDNSLTYTIVLASSATAGSETVSITDQTITVTMRSGGSTATQIKSALDSNVDSASLIKTFISGKATTLQDSGTATLTLNSGKSYVINENDTIQINRIRLDEGDGLDILNQVGSYKSICTIDTIDSSNTALVPNNISNISLMYDSVAKYESDTLTLNGTSLDTKDLSLTIVPSHGITGTSFIEVKLSCDRPDPDDNGVLPNSGDLSDTACDGALCTAVENDPDYVNIIFKVTVKEAGVSHNGWKNIVALGPKVDAYGHSLDSCPHDLVGDISPFSSVVPAQEGLYYYDQKSSHCYVSTGTTSTSWTNADCSSSYSYDEPDCNVGDDVDQCIRNQAPDFIPKNINSMYYDSTSQKCYRSIGTTAITDWKEYLRSATVKLEWEPFTLFASGKSIHGYNIYRTQTKGQFDYERPINKESVIGVESYTDNIKNSYQAPVPGAIYYYEVRPLVGDSNDNEPTNWIVSTPGDAEGYSSIRVLVPPPNMAFVSRRIVNKTMCKLIGKSYDKTAYNRCEYSGPGGVIDPADSISYYDIGNDYIVDRFEQGCPYTIPNNNSLSASCDPSNGCIGNTEPSGAVVNGNVYYSRDTGKCYLASAGTWNLITPNDLKERLAGTDNFANIFISRLAHLPPLTNIIQEDADSFCSNRTQLFDTDITGLPSPIQLKLPNRKEQIAFSLWDDTNLDDSYITAIENGADLNASSKCNANYASGLEDSFVDDAFPTSEGLMFTVTGTKVSGIRSFYTGSDQTAKCVSRFEIQDSVGNVTEWTQDRLFCPSKYVCEFVTKDGATYESSFADTTNLTGQDFSVATNGANLDPDPFFFSQWSFSPVSLYCHYAANLGANGIDGDSDDAWGPDGISGTADDGWGDDGVQGTADDDVCYGTADLSSGAIIPQAVGVRYLRTDSEEVWYSDGLTSADWKLDYAITPNIPDALNTEALWKTPHFDGVFSDSYSDGDSTNDEDFYIYRFDGLRGPCLDTAGSGACDSELSEWYMTTTETISAGRFFTPVGMPAVTNINQDAVTGSDFDLAAQDALRFNSSGISADKIHNDHIQIYSEQIYETDSGCGSMLAGGSYEAGDTAGVYSSQFTPCTDAFDDEADTTDHKPSASAVGFRCLGKIPNAP